MTRPEALVALQRAWQAVRHVFPTCPIHGGEPAVWLWWRTAVENYNRGHYYHAEYWAGCVEAVMRLAK